MIKMNSISASKANSRQSSMGPKNALSLDRAASSDSSAASSLENADPRPAPPELACDVLRHIFGKLDTKDLVACGQVDSLWRSVAKDPTFWSPRLEALCLPPVQPAVARRTFLQTRAAAANMRNDRCILDREMNTGRKLASQMTFSPDGSKLAFFDEKQVHLIDADKSAPMATVQRAGYKPKGFYFSPDSQKMAVSFEHADYESDGKYGIQATRKALDEGLSYVTIVDAASGSVLADIRHPTEERDQLTGAVFLHNSEQVLTYSPAVTRITSLTGDPVASLEGCNHLLLSPKGDRLVMAKDRSAQIIETDTWSLVATLPLNFEAKRFDTFSKFSPDGSSLAVGSRYYRQLLVVDPDCGHVWQDLRDSLQWALGPERNLLTLNLSGKLHKQVLGETDAPATLVADLGEAFSGYIRSDDSGTKFYVRADKLGCLVDLHNGGTIPVARWNLPKSSSNAYFSRNGRKLLRWEQEDIFSHGNITICDTHTGREMSVFGRYGFDLWDSSALSPDGESLWYVKGPYGIKLGDTETGLTRALAGGGSDRHFLLSPLGHQLATKDFYSVRLLSYT